MTKPRVEIEVGCDRRSPPALQPTPLRATGGSRLLRMTLRLTARAPRPGSAVATVTAESPQIRGPRIGCAFSTPCDACRIARNEVGAVFRIAPPVCCSTSILTATGGRSGECVRSTSDARAPARGPSGVSNVRPVGWPQLEPVATRRLRRKSADRVETGSADRSKNRAEILTIAGQREPLRRRRYLRSRGEAGVTTLCHASAQALHQLSITLRRGTRGQRSIDTVRPAIRRRVFRAPSPLERWVRIRSPGRSLHRRDRSISPRFHRRGVAHQVLEDHVARRADLTSGLSGLRMY